MATIDLDKLKDAFTSLHQTDAGRKAMVALRVALDPLRDAITPKVNDAEFLYVLRSIVDELSLEDYSASRGGKVQKKTGELSDSDLEAVVGGAGTAPVFTPQVQRVGDKAAKFPTLGFNLKGVI